jgi:hypothetical protein
MKAKRLFPKRIVARFPEAVQIFDSYEVYDDLTIVLVKNGGSESEKVTLSELSNEDIKVINEGDYEAIQRLLISAKISF